MVNKGFLEEIVRKNTSICKSNIRDFVVKIHPKTCLYSITNRQLDFYLLYIS